MYHQKFSLVKTAMAALLRLIRLANQLTCKSSKKMNAFILHGWTLDSRVSWKYTSSCWFSSGPSASKWTATCLSFSEVYPQSNKESDFHGTFTGFTYNTNCAFSEKRWFHNVFCSDFPCCCENHVYVEKCSITVNNRKERDIKVK